MNLADAIRKASQATGSPLITAPAAPKAQAEDSASAVVYRLSDAITFYPEANEETTGETELEQKELYGHGTAAESDNGGMLKIELYVPPEQLHKVLRTVASTQHSVLTSREAASHLRIPLARVEELAKAGKIPGFMVDGKWRFSRSRLEGWEMANDSNKEQSL